MPCLTYFENVSFISKTLKPVSLISTFSPLDVRMSGGHRNSELTYPSRMFGERREEIPPGDPRPERVDLSATTAPRARHGFRARLGRARHRWPLLVALSPGAAFTLEGEGPVSAGAEAFDQVTVSVTLRVVLDAEHRKGLQPNGRDHPDKSG